MTIRYLDLPDYLALAVAVTGLDIKTVMASVKVDLVDSALHAPSASFAGEEFYLDFCDRAGVLLVRLARNHPLLDTRKFALGHPVAVVKR
ncbi:MAG TPA: hypothetical protein VNE42_11940 [Acidimicrobiales bacterium]|nr:hypothetical protein [Acidimicrobiales bacterium]